MGVCVYMYMHLLMSVLTCVFVYGCVCLHVHAFVDGTRTFLASLSAISQSIYPPPLPPTYMYMYFSAIFQSIYPPPLMYMYLYFSAIFQSIYLPPPPPCTFLASSSAISQSIFLFLASQLAGSLFLLSSSTTSTWFSLRASFCAQKIVVYLHISFNEEGNWTSYYLTVSYNNNQSMPTGTKHDCNSNDSKACISRHLPEVKS